jgi:hypothetical protein
VDIDVPELINGEAFYLFLEGCAMCGVTEMVVASMVMTALSTATSMYAQSEAQRVQQESAEAAAQANAQMAENEAATQQELAKNEISKGIADRERQQRQAARAMGQMRADMGASDFEMDSGSNLSLLAESAGEHQYDSATITSNAQQAAWQHQVGALSATNQKSLYGWQAANAGSGRNAAMIGMGGTLLGGIGQGIGQYSNYKMLQNNGYKPGDTFRQNAGKAQYAGS